SSLQKFVGLDCSWLGAHLESRRFSRPENAITPCRCVSELLWFERTAFRYHAQPSLSVLQPETSRGVQPFAVRDSRAQRFHSTHWRSGRGQDHHLPFDARTTRPGLGNSPYSQS